MKEHKPKERTQSQHNALFLWFTMIEKVAENEGVTWDRLIRHTHQIRVTRENTHEACKQLIKVLWGLTSTKQIKKVGQIEVIVEHFTDWFAKEGLEVPPFPSKEYISEHFESRKLAEENAKLDTEDYKEPKF